jgi:hypothetical protein
MDRDKILHAAANAVASAWLSSQDATSEQMLVGAANLLSASSLADAERRHVIFVLAPDALARMRATPQPDTTTDKVEVAKERFRPRSEVHGLSEYEREQQRIRANLERLRAERFAREAANKKF